MQNGNFQNEDFPKIFYVSMITLISILGLYFRLKGLGNFPFSIDEYYFYSAIKLTIENGLPQFFCGGFYTRGILLQYLTAPLVHLLENQELASRIPAVVFSSLCFPAIYLIGRDSHSRLAGVLALFLFAFSIWQIEFARFARMYAPFQMVFLWQVWLFLRPDFPTRNTNILFSGLIACVGTLFYAGGIFCVALAFFNIMLYQKSFKITEYIPASIAACIAVVSAVIPFRHLGAEPPLPPASYLPKKDKIIDQSIVNNLPIDLPSYFTLSSPSVFTLIITLLYIILAILFLAKFLKNNHLNFFVKTLILLTIFSIFLNQFLLALGLFSICLLTSDAPKDLYRCISNKTGILFLIGTVLWISFCVIYYLITHETHGTLNAAKDIFNQFFSYPDVFFDVFRQWQRPMPIHAIFTVCSIIIIASICFINYLNKYTKLRYFLSIFIAMLLLVALINTPYDTSRYSFFLSPLASICFACCIVHFAKLINNNILTFVFTLIATSAVCYASEDYRFNHLINIDSYKINHRLDYNKEYAEHLYPRYDYISAANFINKNAKSDDFVVITTPVIENYLKNTLRAQYFMTYENSEFVNHSACNGTQETWSGLPLIHNYQNLEKELKNSSKTNWIILHGDRGNPFTTQNLAALKSRLTPYFVYENPDKTLKIYKVIPDNSAIE